MLCQNQSHFAFYNGFSGSQIMELLAAVCSRSMENWCLKMGCQIQWEHSCVLHELENAHFRCIPWLMLEVFLWFIMFRIFCNLHDIHCSRICAYHFVKRRHSINIDYFSHKYDRKLCFPLCTHTSVSKMRSIKIGLDFTLVEVCWRT